MPGYARLRKNITKVGFRLRGPVPGYVWLRKSLMQLGSRLRMVTLVGYATRFQVRYGYVSWLRSMVFGYAWLRLSVTQPGYAWLRKSVMQLGSRLRMVTLVGYATRFQVRYGYVSWLRSMVFGYAWLRLSVTHGYGSQLCSSVPGYVWLR